MRRRSENLISTFLRICRKKDYRRAVEFQESIRDLILEGSSGSGASAGRRYRTVCGLDISFDRRSEYVYAAASVHSYPDLEKIEERSLQATIDFPYVPGLLAFREGPAVLKLVRRIKVPVDILLVDGQGLAHPRGTGIASMIGLLLNMPSVGCAKTRLIGNFAGPAEKKGSMSDLVYNGITVGKAIRTRRGVKPVFVSVGYRLDLQSAIEIVLNSCTRYRIPDPIRAAHMLANRSRTAAEAS